MQISPTVPRLSRRARRRNDRRSRLPRPGARRHATRPTLRSRSVRRGCPLRRPEARRRGHSVDAARRRQRDGLSAARGRDATAASARWSPRRTSRPTRPRTHRSRSRVKGLDPHERLLLPLLHAALERPGRALPDRAAAPGSKRDRSLRLLLLPGVHVRLLQRPRAAWPRTTRLRRQPRRLHLRRRGLRSAPRASRAADCTTSTAAVSAARSTSTAQRTRSTAATRTCGSCTPQFAMISCWDDHEVQNDYSGGDPSGGTVSGDPYTPQRRNDAYRAFFEQMPTLPIGHHAAVPQGLLRPHRGSIRAGRAPVPRSQPLRRQGGASVR